MLSFLLCNLFLWFSRFSKFRRIHLFEGSSLVRRSTLVYTVLLNKLQGRYNAVSLLRELYIEMGDLRQICRGCQVQYVDLVERVDPVESAIQEQSAVRKEGNVVPARAGGLSKRAARLEGEGNYLGADVSECVLVGYVTHRG